MARRKGWYGKADIGKYIQGRKAKGDTYTSIAADLGVSTGTLYNWREKKTKMRESTADRVRDEILFEKAQDEGTISYGDYLKESAYHDIDKSGLDEEQGRLFFEAFGRLPESDDEVRRLVMEETIGGKKVKWLYGRGKDKAVQQAAIDSLRKQGLSLADAKETYNEATGYTTA